MIIEQHYDEEVLIALLDEQATDPHLRTCATCKASLRSIRQVTSALRDETVWDGRELSEEPKRETRDALRAFAFSMAAEDAAAAPWVRSLMARPSTEWRATVDAHAEWHTAGFVRKLVAAVDAINFTAPTDAVELTKIAVDVAEALEGSSERLLKLRATAWREYAYALFYVGRYQESLSALTRGESFLELCVVSNDGLGRIKLLTAYVLAAMEKWNDALASCRIAQESFKLFSDRQRLVTAKLFEASLLMRCNRFAEALPVHIGLLHDEASDEVSRACAAEHASICCRELGRIHESKAFIARAIEIFERRGEVTRAAMSRRHLGRILLAEGRYDEASTVSLAVLQEFKENGMAHDVAIVAVDVAECFLMLGRHDEVASLCASAIEYFECAALTFTEGALTALAFLREAAEKRSLTVAHVSGVRSFFEMLPKQPDLLFARPF